MIAAIAAPAAGALLVLALRRWPNLRDAASLAAGAATFVLVLAVRPGDRATWVEFLPGIPIAFAVEPLGLLFAAVASGLWIATTAYSIGYMRGHHEEHQTRFYFFFAVAIACAIGIAFAANLLTLFLLYEALTLATFPLVTHHGTAEARRAGRVYLGVLLTTSIAFLATAIVWTFQIAGTLDFRPGGILAGRAPEPALAVLLALFAFGTGKAALLPFHRWLPNAMVAPTPVSALLHAVAVVKAGVFTVMKIVVYVFGIATVRDVGEWLCWIASATLLWASLVALTRDNLKERLAYSTIAQLAIIVLAAALGSPSGVVGGALHIATHAFGKITLFFCAGAILLGSHRTRVSELDGIGRRMPFTMAAFTVGSLSIIGFPPLGGSWSKFLIGMGAADRPVFLAVLMAGSLLSLGYLVPIVSRAYFREARGAEAREAPAFCVVPLVATALGTVGLFFLAGWIGRLLEPVARIG